jgi:cell division septal protein FtsQ
MATYLEHRPLVARTAPPDRAPVFQRGHASADVKGGRKKRALRTGHVLALTVLLASFFFALDRAYLFLISWDELTVRKVELAGGRESVRRTLVAFLRTRPIGNILLCDISLLQRELRSYPWVREARIQKVFPATLRIEILERQPLALLEKDGLAVVDSEGTALERSAAAGSWPGLPVVRDENGFHDDFWEKWRTATACLEALTPAERARLAVLECSDDGRISVEFRDDPVRLILDGTSVRERLDRFAACRADLEARFGPLEYADLRLADRIVVRPLEPAAGGPPPNPPKESE